MVPTAMCLCLVLGQPELPADPTALPAALPLPGCLREPWGGRRGALSER